MREARIHVRHVRDLLKSVEPSDAYNGVDCASLSFLNTVTAVGAILNNLAFTSYFSTFSWNSICKHLLFVLYKTKKTKKFANQLIFFRAFSKFYRNQKL